MANIQANGFYSRCKIISDFITLQCKDFLLHENISYIFLKPRSFALCLMREVNVGSPRTKPIFMYCNPVNTKSSFSDLFQKSSSFLRKLFKKGLKDDIILKQLVFPELDNNHMRLQVEDTIKNDDLQSILAHSCLLSILTVYIMSRKMS